ncbi:MAG: serine/threonine-protein kinase [Phycisphaerales bacterium]|nr:serine/threonine-protein kinase [Phycisphaerales bacterium]
MNSDHRQRAKQLFQAAIKLPEDARAQFIADECGSDDAVRAEVQKLLGASESVMGNFLHTPVVESALQHGACESGLPRTIGRYRVVRKIGEGGMGIVYEAKQEKPRRNVALKVIKPGFTTSQMLRRFELEAQALGRLKHPGIGQVYEAGIHRDGAGEVPFMAMELVDGTSLLEYVKSTSPDVREVLRLFAKVCDAVQHAHQKGVIHRDLKPSNILVVEEGAEGPRDQGNQGRPSSVSSSVPRPPGPSAPSSVQPKILDFGIARVTDADTFPATLQTRTGQLIGTLKYMSPEQAAGNPNEIDTRSDVYTLGVILYELLTRRMPYEVDGKLIHEAVRGIQEDEAKPLSSFSRTYRGDLTTILGKALAKKKMRRYQSASELAMDIRRYLNHEPITARPPSALYHLDKFARRHLAIVGGVAAVFVALILGLGLTTWQAHEARQARAAEEEQRKRAERRFNELRGLARTFIRDFDVKIKDLAGSSPARELLVTTALRYLNSLAEDIDPDDIRLQEELGTAYFKLGDILGDPRVPNLGNADEALTNYLKGLRFVENVAEVKGDAESQKLASLALNRIGTLLESMGRHNEAQAYFNRALEDFIRLCRQFPDDPGIKLELAQCHRIRLDVCRRQSRLEKALSAAREAMELYEAVVESNPEFDLARHGVASTSSIISEIRDQQQRFDDALAYRLKSHAILESLSRDRPHNAVFRRDFGAASERVGFSYQRAEKLDKALPFLKNAVEIGEALVDAEPSHVHYQIDLARGLCRLGEVHLALGDAGKARETFDRHVRLCADFAESRANDGGVQRALGVAYYKMAELSMALAKDEALNAEAQIQHWQQARFWLKKCHAVFAEMRNRRILSESDAGVLDEIAGEIASCDAVLARTSRGEVGQDRR